MNNLDQLEKDREYHDQLAQHHLEQYLHHENKLLEVEALIKKLEEVND